MDKLTQNEITDLCTENDTLLSKYSSMTKNKTNADAILQEWYDLLVKYSDYVKARKK